MKERTLDLVIPAHNEEAVIVPTLKLVSEALSKIPDLSWRIIVAENGSSDNTFQVVALAKLPHVEVFSSKTKGKGAAIKEAASRGGAAYFGFVDADCSADPIGIVGALEALEQEKVALVIGSRFHRNTTTDRGLFRELSSRVFNLFAHFIVQIQAEDSQCPLKIMDRRGKNILMKCRENTWFLDLELIARTESAGLPIATIPVRWTESRYPKRKSKLNVGRDGMRAVLNMIQLRKHLHKK